MPTSSRAPSPSPTPIPTGRFNEEPGPSDQPTSLATAMPFDMVIGSCNPLAPPLVLDFDPPIARGQATFTPPFEGAPGCVHGAALAATFDIMLTAANVIADAAGPTIELRIRYLKPTLIDRPAHFEASVVSVDGRRTHSSGRLTQDGVVTVEAEGEFMSLRRGGSTFCTGWPHHAGRRRPARRCRPDRLSDGAPDEKTGDL